MRLATIGILGALLGTVSGCDSKPSDHLPFATAIVDMLPTEVIREANGGRELLESNGYFAIPKGVTRVWVDVGAHHLETTLPAVRKNPDLALVAIEPLAEAWAVWPESPRIIGIPFALGRERGWMDFHVNWLSGASSLLKTDPGLSLLPLTDLAAITVEVRKVPVLLLEDVLERIPPEIDIEFLKLDIQGVDLQVLKSAREQLRRVWHVKTEVIVHNEGVYLGEGEDAPGSEAEFTSYMESMGFRFVRDWNISRERMWLDKEYINADLERSDPRIGRPNPDLQVSLGR